MNTLQFEVKFHSSDFEKYFPATTTFNEIIDYIKSYYIKVTLKYSNEGFNVLSDGEHVGTIKPCYPDNNKVEWLHKLLK
jgi:hypothetical protein